MRYRFSLIDYTINSAGVTTVLTEDEVLGWEEMEIIAKRDSVWHGIFFESSYTKLIFVGEGYSVIKTAYDDSGSNANTDLFIEASCGDNDAFEALDTARLKYSRIKFIEEDSCRVEVPVEGTSCLQLFRSRYDQKVNLLSRRTFDLAPGDPDDLSDYDSKFPEISLPSKPIFFNFHGIGGENDWSVVSGQLDISQNYIMISSFDYENLLRDDIKTSTPVAETVVEDQSLPYNINNYTLANNGLFHITDNIVCTGKMELRVRLKGTFREDTLDTRRYDATIRLRHVDADNVLLQDEELVPPFGGNPIFPPDDNEHSFDRDKTFNLNINNGDKIFIYIIVSNYSQTTGNQHGQGFTMTIEWDELFVTAELISDCAESDAKVFLINEALSRTSEIITNDCLRVYSDYFGRTDALPYDSVSDGCGALESISNGLYIRRAKKTDESDPDFFVSMKHLFDSLTAIHNIGIGLEDDTEPGQDQLLRVEPVEYFYVDTILKTISDQETVFEIQRTFDVKRAIAVFNFGYKKWESEYNGGLDEIQTKREYRTQLTNVDTKLDKLSDFIAASYAIEITRRVGTSTEDYKYDNDTFIICLQRDGGNFEVEIFTDLVTTNLLSDTNLYNVRISPRRNFMRWYKSIRTTASSRFTFNAGDANYIAIVNKTNNDDCLLELQASDMGEDEGLSANHFKAPSSNYTPIWLPEIWEFEYPLSYEEYKVIRANPTGRISVNHQGVETQCFIEEITYSPVDGIAKWKLLRAWQNV